MSAARPDRSNGAPPLERPDRISARNPRVVRLRRLVRDPDVRRADGAFVVEGLKLVAAALDAAAPLEALYVTAEASTALVARAANAGAEVYEIGPQVLRQITDAVTPQPVVAVVGRIDAPLDEVRSLDPLLVCVDVRDPGNLGAILRSALATGTGAVICCTGTVDVYNPKCVRASAGALFHLPVVAGGEPGQVLETLGRWGCRRLAAEASGGLPPEQYDLTGRTALVLGNEARGLAPALDRHLDGRITIPMAAPVESLNVGVAAAVLCFEVARQRRVATE